MSTHFGQALQAVNWSLSGEGVRRLHERAWGGGTSLGVCLNDFRRRFGGALLGGNTVVVICSDGLDTGAPELLRTAMHDLHRRSAGIIWLNPLIETPGYTPTACGMRVALPYVETFVSANDLAGSRAWRVRFACAVRMRSLRGAACGGTSHCAGRRCPLMAASPAPVVPMHITMGE